MAPAYIVYHTADLDGRGAAAIARQALGPESVLIPMDYQWPEGAVDAIPDGARVYMLDVSLPPRSMHRLGQRCDLVWIDHHTPRIRQILGPQVELPSVTPSRSLSDHRPSACLLTWRFFHPESETPDVVAHIDTWDTATERSGTHWERYTRPMQFALRSHGLDPDHEFWPKLLSMDFSLSLVHFIRPGLDIVRYLDLTDRQAVLSASYRVHCRLDATGCCPASSEFPDPGAVTLTHARVINRHPFDPALLAQHPDPAEGDELLIAYAYDPTARGWRLSVSPGPAAHPNLDAGLLCSTLWGGGGHPGRAGATLPELPDWLLPSPVAAEVAR